MEENNEKEKYFREMCFLKQKLHSCRRKEERDTYLEVVPTTISRSEDVKGGENQGDINQYIV